MWPCYDPIPSWIPRFFLVKVGTVMSPDQIKFALETSIQNSEVHVSSDGSHVHVTVVSAVFEGLNAVKKQQLVYSALNDAIASGAIHAVHMKTYTPTEWAAQSE